MKKWITPIVGLLVIAQASAQVNTPPADAGGALTPEQKEKFSAADPEDITNENFPQLIQSFDFPNADLADVVQAISELTGKNFIIDPGLRGKITIIAPTQITVAEAYRAFLSALAINGFTVVPSGRFLKIKSARNAQRDSIETYSGDYFPDTDQMITRIIHLKHISASQVDKNLRILPSKEGEIAVYEPTNSIIMSDYGSNIERVMTILNQLDVPGFEEQLEVVNIEHATAKDIAELVDQIVNKDQGGAAQARGGARRSSFRSRFSRGGGSDDSGNGASFNVIPDDRTNSLIVVGNRAGITKIKKLIRQLDFKLDPNSSGGVYVYYVKHGEAEKIAATLNGVAQADQKAPAGPGAARGRRFTPPGQAGQDVFGGEVKITASEDTNSLIIVASRQDYESVSNLLSKIDIPRDQVFVEAIIMELALEDRAKYGLGYYNFQDGTNGMGRQGFNGIENLGDLAASPLAGVGTILGFSTGNKVSVPIGPNGQSVEVGSLTGFINLLKGNSRTNVLSTPQIVALDNEEATIEVGEKVPTSFTTQNNANGTTSTSANFEDATIKLTIKPFISPTINSVRMEIDQSIRLPKGEVPSNLQQQALTLTTRSVKTNIVVPNGDTAVLGGLMRDDSIETVTKVPVLGDIPILGWLFKSTSMETKKVNLLIFLTPKIIRNAGDTKQLLGKKLDQRLEFVKQSGGQDPYGSAVEDIRQKAEAGSLPSIEQETEEFNF